MIYKSSGNSQSQKRNIDRAWVYQHGWGLGSECWEGWPGVKWDRGYFGNAFSCPIPENALVVTHSFGLHLIPLHSIKQLVIMSGFLHIHSDAKTKAYLKWLLKALKKNPKSALHQFYLDCGVNKPVPGTLNLSLLLSDLERLNDETLDYSLLLQIPKILILHGVQDRIAKLDKAIELHNLLPQSKLVKFDQGDHALPMSLTKECQGMIQTLFL